MTEEEWLACSDPQAMRLFLERRGHKSNRKLRLFAVACCRRFWSGLRGDRSRAAVETAERYADGLATVGELRAAFTAAYAAVDDCLHFSPFSEDQAVAAYLSAARNITESDTEVPEEEDTHEVVAHAISYAVDGDLAVSHLQYPILLRDIVGNPFRPVSFAPAWRTSTAVALAKQMYESRDFGAMPILADALQDAGCDNADILDHCRGPGPHVRGCWVVDQMLGKE